MKKHDVTKIFNMVKRTVGKKSPEILIAFGIAGMITTTVLAVKATPKAVEKINEEKKKQNEEFVKKITGEESGAVVGFKLKKKDIIKVTWKYYIPAAVSGAASIACIIGANTVHSKRNAAIATAYKLSEKALAEYKGAVLEEVGEEKAKTIKDRVVQKQLDDNPASNNQVIITGHGKQLCYDGISGRYFESDLETIRAAVNRVNRNMTYDMYVSLSDFYDELELEHTDMSDDLGWNLDDGLLEIDYGTRLADNGKPCITLEYHVAPRYDFSKLM